MKYIQLFLYIYIKIDISVTSKELKLNQTYII